MRNILPYCISFLVVLFYIQTLYLTSTEDSAVEVQPTDTVNVITADVSRKDSTASTNELNNKSFHERVQTAAYSEFIESAVLNGNTAEIEYYTTYADYTTSITTESKSVDEFNAAFISEYNVDILLLGESVRLLNYFPTLTVVKLTLPYGEDTKTVSIDRDGINNLVGYRVEDLSTTEGTWVSDFMEPYVYDEKARTSVLNNFVVATE